MQAHHLSSTGVVACAVTTAVSGCVRQPVKHEPRSSAEKQRVVCTSIGSQISLLALWGIMVVRKYGKIDSCVKRCMTEVDAASKAWRCQGLLPGSNLISATPQAAQPMRLASGRSSGWFTRRSGCYSCSNHPHQTAISTSPTLLAT